MLTEIVANVLVFSSMGMFAAAGDYYGEFLGKVDFDQEQFARTLEGRHRSYDPEERMIYQPYSTGSYRYHTAYKGNVVHPTRGSFDYAIDCLDSGVPELIQRGVDILDRMVDLQDTDRESRTFGIWSYYLEEPLDKMDAPDFNWADFCGVQLLQAELRHKDKLPVEVEKRVRQAILNACFSIRRRNVGPGYTNIALMSTYVVLVAGRLFSDEGLMEYGRERLDRFHKYTLRHGCFTEFNSPTYTMVALRELGRMLRDVNDEDCMEKIADLYRLAWTHIGRHFHQPTRQWAGPQSRAYRDLEGKGFWHFIQRATDNQVQFVPPEKIPFDRGYALLSMKCPRESVHYFKSLDKPRHEIEMFFGGSEALPEAAGDKIGDLPIVGTTLIHPAFAFGSANRCDFWNQRRPLIIHCGSWDKPSYARLRFLHDDYDYSLAMSFIVQWMNKALIGLNFATNYGDKHLSLHKVINATIQAEDLRLRMELGGDLSSLELPQSWDQDTPARVKIGGVWIQMKATFAEFGDLPIKYEVGRNEEKAWIDLVIYNGQERSINFRELETAALGIALEVSDTEVAEDSFSDLDTALEDGRLTQRWDSEGKSLELKIPVKPDEVGKLQKQPIALIDGKAPWEFAEPSFER